MIETRPNRWLADLSLMATAWMWGINILVVKQVLTRVDPLAFNAIRMVLSVIALGICVGIERPRAPTDTTKFRLKQFLLFALLSSLVYPLLFMRGIRQTTAGNTALLLASMPMWTAVLSFIFVRERLSPITWLGLLMTSLGTVMIAFSGGKISLSASHLQGNLYMLAAAICWASATVVSRPLLSQISPLRLAFCATVLATPIHLLLTIQQLPITLSTLAEPALTASTLYSGIMSTGIAYATWHLGVRQLGASHAAAYQNVVTLVGVLGGWLVLSETITAAQIAGGLSIVAGLLLMRQGRR